MIEVTEYPNHYELADLKTGQRRTCSMLDLLDALDEMEADTRDLRRMKTELYLDGLRIFAAVFADEASRVTAKRWIMENLTPISVPGLDIGSLRNECEQAIVRHVSRRAFTRALMESNIHVAGDSVYARHRRKL